MRESYFREEAWAEKRYSLGQGLVVLGLAVTVFFGVRYIRRHPAKVAGWIEQVQSGKSATKLVSTEFEEIPSLSYPPLEGMKEVERQLQSAFRKYRYDRPNDALIQQVDQLVQRSESFCEVVQDQEEFTDVDRRLAKMRLLKTHFLAARMNRQESFAQFDTMSQPLIDQSQYPAEAAEAASLRLLKRHRFDSPDVRRLIEDLTTFVATYPDSPIGVQLFSATSHELWRKNLGPSASEVLRAGIAIYYGQPEGNQLVSQLAEQDERFSRVHHGR